MNGGQFHFPTPYQMPPAAPCPRSSAPRFTAVCGVGTGADKPSAVWRPNLPGQTSRGVAAPLSPPRLLALSRCAPPARGMDPPLAFTRQLPAPPEDCGEERLPPPENMEKVPPYRLPDRGARRAARRRAAGSAGARPWQRPAGPRRRHGTGGTDGTDGRDGRDGWDGRDGREPKSSPPRAG